MMHSLISGSKMYPTCLLMRSLLSWDATQHRLVVNYRHFGTKYRSQLQGSSSPKTGLLDLDDVKDMLSRNVVTDYQSTLRDIPEEQRSHLHSGRSLKSHMLINVLNYELIPISVCMFKSLLLIPVLWCHQGIPWDFSWIISYTSQFPHQSNLKKQFWFTILD
jgi:hypothetical protein